MPICTLGFVNATGRSDPGLRVKSSFAWRRMVDPLPGAAKLTRPNRIRIVRRHVPCRTASREAVPGRGLRVDGYCIRECPCRRVRERGGKDGARDARERVQIPSLGKVCGDGILNAMYSRMDVIATFQPWRELWVRTTAVQIDDEIARDCHGAVRIW